MKQKEILVYDNFLDKKNFLELKENLYSGYFPWYYFPSIDYLPTDSDFVDYEQNFQFQHFFYDKCLVKSDKFFVLDALLQKINPTAIIRIKANLLTRTEKIIQNKFHCDFSNKLSKTAIFYVNTNNGKTIFSNGEKIDSVENRLIVFDCDVLHTGTTCTNEKTRCVINLNFYKEESIQL
jgi:hypothetical protein